MMLGGEARLYTLRGGRTLEVVEYGDPSGHPAFFFHGMIGSHLQASYIGERAGRRGLRLIAPNRPGVGRSEFVRRARALEAVDDVEDLAGALGLGEFSLIGISGGTPYALACLHRIVPRIKTVTLLSGMGPIGLRGALRGMDRARRMGLEVGSRFPKLALREFRRWATSFRLDPVRFLDRFVAIDCRADRTLFRGRALRETFLGDMHQVFESPHGPESLAQELRIYRDYGFALADLSPRVGVTIWQGLDDDIVPPSMAWALTRRLPNREAHFVPGGHFVAASIADRIIDDLARRVEATP